MTSSKHDQQRKNSGFGISVKDARIDPIRLLASNTSSKKISSSFSSKPSSSTTKKKSEYSFDAIQFELSISFSGRTYTAMRTLPRIVQLRNELITEMDAQRNRWNSRRRSHHHQRYVHEQETGTEKENGQIYDKGISVGNDGDDMGEITIPELPECVQENDQNGSNCGGIGARGFTMLQALVRNYCPVVEGWLLNVADIVNPSSSQSLANFLWEPLDNSYNNNSSNMDVASETNSGNKIVKTKREEASKRDRRNKFYRYHGGSAPNSSSTLESIDEES